MTIKRFRVTITLHDGSTVTISDSTTTTDGFAAMMALEHGETLKSAGDGENTYIPFHSVIKYTVVETVIPIQTPADEFCDTETTTSDAPTPIPLPQQPTN